MSEEKTYDKTAVEFHKVNRSTEVWCQFWKTARWVAVSGFAYLALDSLAGKTTLASFIVNIFAVTQEEGVSKWWVYTSIAAILWAFIERVLRQRKVKSMSKRLENLEKTRDPNRTSSGLTREGETPTLNRRRD